MEEQNVIIKLRNVSKVYRSGDVKTYALKNIDLDIRKGEFLVLLGNSGSGKSSLLNLLGGLDRPTSGEIEVYGKDIGKYSEREIARYRRDHVGFIFQFYNLIQDLTAYENVELAAGITAQNMTVEEALEAVELQHRKNHYPAQLSGGEQQRVSISRAIIKKADILICDEPTGALDSENGVHILSIIDELRRRYGKTVIMATHVTELAKIEDRMIVIKNGEIIKMQENAAPISIREVGW